MSTPLKTILFVEADDNQRQLLLDELAPLLKEMKIIMAKDGVDAGRKTLNQEFSLIVTNWNIPKKSGLENIESIRGGINEKTPILIYEEESLQEAKAKATSFRPIDFIQKPLSYEDLAKKIIEFEKADHSNKKFKLDVDFINPIIHMSISTIEELCNFSGTRPLPPYVLKDEEVLDVDISGVINIVSPFFSGVIGVSFSDEIFKQVISKMIDDVVDNIDNENQDGAAEIINIIYGRTKSVMNQKGFAMQRAVPSVLRGANHRVTNNKKRPVLMMPINSEIGRFYIQISVKPI